MKKQPKIITGGFTVDQRGKVAFVNDFAFKKVKRFYQVKNLSRNPIRAFHGHMKEGKYVYVAAGSILLVLAPLDNSQKPSKNVKLYRYFLSEDKPAVVYVPPKFANGFKTLEKNTKVLFFSTCSLKESKKDTYRFPYDYWSKEIWQIKDS